MYVYMYELLLYFIISQILNNLEVGEMTGLREDLRAGLTPGDFFF